MTMAFGPNRRLRKHREFAHAQRVGLRVTTPSFVLLVAPQPDSDERSNPRIGFIVSRKVGTAVRRNRIKRMCRECFRTWPNLLPPGVDLVVIAKPVAPAKLSLGAVRAEWEGASAHLRRRAMEALRRGGPRGKPSPRSPEQ